MFPLFRAIVILFSKSFVLKSLSRTLFFDKALLHRLLAFTLSLASTLSTCFYSLYPLAFILSLLMKGIGQFDQLVPEAVPPRAVEGPRGK